MRPSISSRISKFLSLSEPSGALAMPGNGSPRRLSPTKVSTHDISWPYTRGMRRLPPLSAVRVFEAAARHENFTQAAAELGMTQAAVSYQIRLLEERLGMPLFARVKGRVPLTEAGRRIAPLVAARLRTSTTPSPSSSPRIRRLLTISTPRPSPPPGSRRGSALPGRPSRARGAPVDRRRAGRFLDRRGPRRDPRRARRLAGPRAPSSCSGSTSPRCAAPTSSRAHGGRIDAAELLDCRGSARTTIGGRLAAEVGRRRAGRPARPGLLLEIRCNGGNAAIAGAGRRDDDADLLAQRAGRGRLVRPSTMSRSRGYGYWLVYPEAPPQPAQDQRFRDWLLAEVESDLEDPGLALSAVGVDAAPLAWRGSGEALMHPPPSPPSRGRGEASGALGLPSERRP